MKTFCYLHLLLLLLVSMPVYGQKNLLDMPPSSVDSLVKSEIRYFSPGKGGKNRVWDFSRKLCSKESSLVKFNRDSNDVVSVYEHGRIKYYHVGSDTLCIFASESPLSKRNYVVPKMLVRFPLEYRDSIGKNFMCEGMYCRSHPFREIGTTMMQVDAEGSIVLSENDTIKNVRRVHSIDSYSICMDNNISSLDTARSTQVIEERYEWYLPESLYPIFEDVISSTYYDMDAIATTRYAYCNLPDNLAGICVMSDNDDDDSNGEHDVFSDEDTQVLDIIHYHIETIAKAIQITYDLDAEATVTTIVANHMGMQCLSMQMVQSAGQGYTARIDCGGLSSGVYILYINVNGKVYSEKVIL
ncbi:MAG: T9SS type A sorting domain-containing protein [Prevotella sp.]|nr:T9SS type A sorting domain-containing protein [Prevotella sp.]